MSTSARRSPYLREVSTAEKPTTPEALEDIARVVRLLEKLQRAGLYGKVTLGFQNGKLVAAQLEQTIKAVEL